jgi:hypothetical protein
MGFYGVVGIGFHGKGFAGDLYVWFAVLLLVLFWASDGDISVE